MLIQLENYFSIIEIEDYFLKKVLLLIHNMVIIIIVVYLH